MATGGSPFATLVALMNDTLDLYDACARAFGTSRDAAKSLLLEALYGRSDVPGAVLATAGDDWLRDYHFQQTVRGKAAFAAGDFCAHKAYVERLVDVSLEMARRNARLAAKRAGAPGDLIAEVLSTLGLIDDLLAGTAIRLDGTGERGEYLQSQLRLLQDRVVLYMGNVTAAGKLQ